MLDDGLLPSEGLARRVVRPVAHRDRPLRHGADPLPYPPRGLRLVVPDRGQDCEHIKGVIVKNWRRDSPPTFAFPYGPSTANDRRVTIPNKKDLSGSSRPIRVHDVRFVPNSNCR